MKALTPREKELLPLFLEGNTTKQVAELSGIGFKTAETHRNRLLKKYAVHSMIELVNLIRTLEPPPAGKLDSNSEMEELYREYSRIGEIIRRRVLGDQSVTISSFKPFLQSLPQSAHPFSCVCAICRTDSTL